MAMAVESATNGSTEVSHDAWDVQLLVRPICSSLYDPKVLGRQLRDFKSDHSNPGTTVAMLVGPDFD